MFPERTWEALLKSIFPASVTAGLTIELLLATLLIACRLPSHSGRSGSLQLLSRLGRFAKRPLLSQALTRRTAPVDDML
jgi:hypothetical protein